MRILYIDNGKGTFPPQAAFRAALEAMGELTVIPDGSELSEEEKAVLMRQFEVYITGRSEISVPDAIAENPGRLQLICGLTGTQRPFIKRKHIESGLIVTNWGPAPADGIAEGAMTLLLAVLKDLRAQVETLNDDGWDLDPDVYVGGTLKNMDLGIYGLGAIGERFVALVRPFGPVIHVFDPFVEKMPEFCTKVDTLDELFSRCQAIVIHAGLTEATRRSVTATLLSRLPDNGIVVNTARGEIIDQQALFRELQNGRLRAGLDVLAGRDRMEPGDPAKKWTNVIFTTHKIARNRFVSSPTELRPNEATCLENIRRFAEGRELLYVMTEERFDKST